MQTNRKAKMSRIRLNQEYRNKGANRMRVHLEQEPTQEKQDYDNQKADQLEINDNAWSLAEKIVRRHYPMQDVEKAYYLQNKYPNVDNTAKDSCFHFGYMAKKRASMRTTLEVGVEITKNKMTSMYLNILILD